MSDTRSGHSSTAAEHATTDAERTIDVDELLAVLAEEYTGEILATLGDESLPAREIAERAGVSRPTVYRRLNRLEAIGAVETATARSPGGQHRKEFQLVLEEVEFPIVYDDVEPRLADDATVRTPAQYDPEARCLSEPR